VVDRPDLMTEVARRASAALAGYEPGGAPVGPA
jgi:hypothetical protein